MEKWYIIYKGQTIGPLSLEEMRLYRPTQDMRVWREGMAEWQPLFTIPELMREFIVVSNNTHGNASAQNHPAQQPQYQQSQYQQPQQPQYQQPQQQAQYQEPQQQYQEPQQQYQEPQQYQQPQQQYQQPPYPNGGSNQVYYYQPSDKSPIVAGILAILLGEFGIQYFYVGKTTAGIVVLIITLFTFCGGGIIAILGIVQGIMMLTMGQEKFDEKYVNTPNQFPLF